LDFNAGVTVSIDAVDLLIQNASTTKSTYGHKRLTNTHVKVTAKVLLEARLENLVMMISDVLDSIDLNPIVATLGQDVTSLANSTLGDLTSTVSSTTGSLLSKRNFELEYNILYSVNDYSGSTIDSFQACECYLLG